MSDILTREEFLDRTYNEKLWAHDEALRAALADRDREIERLTSELQAARETIDYEGRNTALAQKERDHLRVSRDHWKARAEAAEAEVKRIDALTEGTPL